MGKLNFSANCFKSHVFVISTFISYSASCNKTKPVSEPPKQPDNSISKEEEERILREKEAEENNNLIRDLSINKVRGELHGDDNSIKNGELIASVLVDANNFFKKKF